MRSEAMMFAALIRFEMDNAFFILLFNRLRQGHTVDTSPKKIRIGVVGGNFGCQFQWHEHPDCIVEAVSDLIPERRDRLPEPLRHSSGHEGSHTFLTHEFIDALTHDRRPTVDIREALAYTVPGILAHESALKGGELKKIPRFYDVYGGRGASIVR